MGLRQQWREQRAEETGMETNPVEYTGEAIGG